jgi:hypothetical protein
MLQQLRDISFEDVDKSALTWYYALSMDLLLDVGIIIESYEICATYANKILGQYIMSICKNNNFILITRTTKNETFKRNVERENGYKKFHFVLLRI